MNGEMFSNIQIHDNLCNKHYVNWVENLTRKLFYIEFHIFCFRCPIASLDCMEEFSGQHVEYGRFRKYNQNNYLSTQKHPLLIVFYN